MMLHDNPQNGPVMRAAKMALETGNANYVLIWVPEGLENTLKNLLEKTCCKRSARKNMQIHAIDWYFESVNRLHCSYGWPHCLGMNSERANETPIGLIAERAFETGNFEEIIGFIPNTQTGNVRQRFHNVMSKRNYNVNDIAAGRAYVSAFIDFISYLYNLQSGNTGETDCTDQ